MLNHAHVFANLLDKAVARGVMSREDAESHPERESLTSYIGAEKLDEIDRNTEAYMLSEGDAILLATDGMFKTLDNSEILACLTGNPHLWPEALVDRTMAKKREHQDNVTVLSVSMENGDAPAAHRPLAIDETKTLQISRPPQEAAVPMTPVAAAVAPAAPVPPSAPAVAPAATPVATPIATPVATPSAGPVAGPSAGPSATPVAAPVAAAPKAAAAAVPGWTAKPISPPPAELVKSGKPLNSARFTLAAAVILLLVILIGTVAGLQYRAHHQPHPPAAQSASPEPAPVPLETPPPPASDKARQVPAAASGAKGRGRGATKEHGAPRAEHDAPPPATQ
jgi:sulfur transfer complex TusBCD TusB component (DsrH family)